MDHHHQNHQSLAKSLTKDVLQTVSPIETLLVDSYDPAGTSAGATARGPQGFGSTTELLLLMPFIYKFFDAFLGKLGGNAGDLLWKTLDRWLAVGAVPDSAAQDRAALDAVRAELQQLGVPEERRQASAEAILRSLRKSAPQLARTGAG